MQRRARTFITSVTLATALVGGLGACTSSAGEGGGSNNPKPGDSSATPATAPSGKYRTLPEPCGAVSVDTLEDLLPGETADSRDEGNDSITNAPPDSSPNPYEGEASVTYDTDRRAGCTWKSSTNHGSHHLSVDFERVVSYDPDVSDDEQSEALYAKRAEHAGIDPSADPSEAPGDTASESDSEESSGSPDPSGSGELSESPEDGSSQQNGAGRHGDRSPQTVPPTTTPSPSGLPGRTLDDLGDAAFIDDELSTTKSSLATRRDVQLTFRTANVLVTVKYGESAGEGRQAPNSGELQERTEDLGQQLVETFDD